MKNELPASAGGETVNLALPSTGASKVMSIFSDENASDESDFARSTP